CWLAHGTEGDDVYVIKNAWRYSVRNSEGDMLRLASTRNVKGIAIYVGHEDRECVEDILEGVKITATVPLNKRKRSAPELYSMRKRTRVSEISQLSSNSSGV